MSKSTPSTSSGDSGFETGAIINADPSFRLTKSQPLQQIVLKPAEASRKRQTRTHWTKPNKGPSHKESGNTGREKCGEKATGNDEPLEPGQVPIVNGAGRMLTVPTIDPPGGRPDDPRRDNSPRQKPEYDHNEILLRHDIIDHPLLPRCTPDSRWYEDRSSK